MPVPHTWSVVSPCATLTPASLYVSLPQAYIPQISIRAFPYPLLSCDIDDIDERFIGWSTADSESLDKHNMIYDVPYEGMKRHRNEPTSEAQEGVASRPLFSIVKHWPPDWASKEDSE